MHGYRPTHPIQPSQPPFFAMAPNRCMDEPPPRTQCPECSKSERSCSRSNGIKILSVLCQLCSSAASYNVVKTAEVTSNDAKFEPVA
mmetsp:Transcript_21475/g.50045  ORF Transcript_21475/g.50045 Transcript_21475/m.50045 type:complete len:87 (+) Transcript_21475:2058-2318(+)